MKKTVLYSIIIMGMIGCQKDISTNNSSSGPTTFKFKANGTLYQWDGDGHEQKTKGSAIGRNEYPIDGSNWSGKVYYTIGAVDRSDPNQYGLSMDMFTDKLTIGTYHSTDAFRSYPDQRTSFSLEWLQFGPGSLAYRYQSPTINDSFTIVITKFANHRADGTFTGSMTLSNWTNVPNLPSKMVITEGEFHNVYVLE